MEKKIVHKKPYSILADIYDYVMSDVDYETWADYIDEIILTHNPNATNLLELACGTGTVALSLEELDCYDITATDGSKDMIKVAKEKALKRNSEIHFEQMDILKFHLKDKFDVIYMIFDSLNYLHQKSDIIKLHQNVRSALKPDGIFIYDFTTPINSRKAIRLLNRQTQEIDHNTRFTRESSYDSNQRIHTNSFKIEMKQNNIDTFTKAYTEIHNQRIYTLDQITSIIDETDFTILESYDGLQLRPANEKSLRITMVLK